MTSDAPANPQSAIPNPQSEPEGSNYRVELEAYHGPLDLLLYLIRREEVDIYNDDGTISHDGAWRAGEPDEDGVAEPGIIMPGTFILGSRYYQEVADGIALDQAEHTAMGLDVEVPAGTFKDCVQVIETTPLEPDAQSEKVYCPEMGLTLESSLELVKYGFVNRDDNPDNENE